MKLYFHPACPHSQKVLIGLYEKQVGFETKVVDLSDPAQKSAFERLYPIGRLPLLMLSDHYVAESSIILEYVDLQFPTNDPLIPVDPASARRVRFQDRLADSYLTHASERLSLELERPEQTRNQTVMDQARHDLDVTSALFDQLVSRPTWNAGQGLTLADCALLAALEHARPHLPLERRQNLVRYLAQLEQRPSVARVLAGARQSR